MIRILQFLFLLLFTGTAYAQSAPDSSQVDLTTIQQSKDITRYCQFHVDSNQTVKAGQVPEAAWRPLKSINTDTYIPNSWITKPIFLKVRLTNSSDTLMKVYLIASTYIKRMRVYYLRPDQQPPAQLKDESWQDGYQPINLAPGEQEDYVIELHYTKRNYNYIIPTLVKDDYLQKYKNLKYFRNDAQPAAGYVLSGVLLMMIFFMIANYLQTQKKEFLYNCCYSLCMFLLVFLNTFLDRKSGAFSSMFNEYLDFMLLATGTVFYIAFTRRFLDTKTNYPFLNRLFAAEQVLILVILACFTLVVCCTDFFQLQEIIENGLKAIILIIGIIYIGIALQQKNKLMNYLAAGNAMLILFSLISFYFILFQPRKASILTNAMIYYELGIVCELAFFLTGLAYKNRILLIEKIGEQASLKLEAEKLSYETKLAVLNAQQKERNRISADMHDDLGAGMTAIRLYSELAKKRLGEETIPEIEKISSSANELLNNMNAIIWTMSSSNDSLDNMVAYIRTYALEYLENTGIVSHIDIEENIPNVVVSGELRRHVFLVVKEALSNILKHSKATDVYFTLKTEADGLALYIHDNGIGIDLAKLRRFGNGLNNMKKRMDEALIDFSIENKNGTLIRIHRKWEP